MRLSAKFLKNVANVNHWEYSSTVYIQENQSNEFYLQIVDMLKIHDDEVSPVLPSFPLRYIPQGTVISLEATFESIDDSQVFTITASQPFSDDTSIWKIDLTSSQVPQNGVVTLTLPEDGVEKLFKTQSAVSVDLLNSGGC